MKITRALAMAAGILAAAAAPVFAHHTLKQKEEALRYRENYLELTNRVAPTFTLRHADSKPCVLRISEARSSSSTSSSRAAPTSVPCTATHGLRFNLMNLIVHVTALTNEYHE